MHDLNAELLQVARGSASHKRLQQEKEAAAQSLSGKSGAGKMDVDQLGADDFSSYANRTRHNSGSSSSNSGRSSGSKLKLEEKWPRVDLGDPRRKTECSLFLNFIVLSCSLVGSSGDRQQRQFASQQ